MARFAAAATALAAILPLMLANGPSAPERSAEQQVGEW